MINEEGYLKASRDYWENEAQRYKQLYREELKRNGGDKI